MHNATLPKRSEGDRAHQWKLEDIFPNNGAWEAEYKQADAAIAEAAAWAGRLSESAATLLAALKSISHASFMVERLFTYARMRRDEDNANTLYQGMTDRAGAISVRLQSALAWTDPEVLAIEPAKLEGFFAEEAGLGLFRHSIDEITRNRAHTLSAEEEKLLAMAGEALEGAGTVFTMLNNADLKFPTIKDENGADVQITHGRFIPLLESKDRRVRKDAFEGLYHTYGSFRNTVTATLASNVKAEVFLAQAHKFDTTLEGSLHGDAVPVAVYDSLIAAVRAHLPTLHRYMGLRKRVLGLDELHMYDLYVPMIDDVEMKVTYPEACKMLLEGLKPLGPDYIAILGRSFSEGWIDVFENQGKTSGAYSWGVWGTHPYVLLNWNDTVDNAFTLAHEMGHAMHSYLSDTNLPYEQAQYPILLAEIASTCNEYIFMDYMLGKTTDKRERLYLMNHFLEQIRTTVIRQVMFAEFEKIIHTMQEQGEALTSESLCAAYRQLNLDYYGPDMVVDHEIDMEWARIPHFYGAYYVYKYATGFASAVSLAEMVLRGGEPERRRYLKLLSSGGRDYPLNLLREAGVDLMKPDAVEACLLRFAKLIDEMEALL